MTVKTLCRYLLGNKEAIQEVANQPRLLWLGLLFVLSAGLASEYDNEDLVHEPWYLLIPFVLSVVSSILLYAWIRVVFQSPKGETASFPISYLMFLKLFWLTAPLAWLFAIPTERFLSADSALMLNVCLAGGVMIWRITLIARSISILQGCSFRMSFYVVMFFSVSLSLATFLLSLVTPAMPLSSYRRGIEKIIGESLSHQLIQFWFMSPIGLFIFAVFLVGTMHSWTTWRNSQSCNIPRLSKPVPAQPIKMQLWVLAITSLLIWIPVLQITQAEQSNRRHAESLYKEGNVAGAVEFMSSLEPGQFPPHWSPPPKRDYRKQSTEMLDYLDYLLTVNSAPWVLESHVKKLRRHVYFSPIYGPQRLGLDTVETTKLKRFVEFLESRPDFGQELADELYSEIVQVPEKLDPKDFEDRREYYNRLLKLAHQYHNVPGTEPEILR